MLMRSFVATAVAVSMANAQAVPEAITYQGFFQSNDTPFTGEANFVIKLFDSDGQLDEVELDEVMITDGLFTVPLRFDPRAFDGRFLEIEFIVEAPANGGTTETLTPRQPLNTAPYAFHSATSTNATTADAAANADFAVSAASADVASLAATATNAANLDLPAIFSNSAVNQPVLRVIDTSPTSGFGAVEIIGGTSPNLALQGTVLTVKSGETPIGIAGLGRSFGMVGTANDASMNGAFGVFAQATALDGAKASTQIALRAFHQSSGIFADLGTATHAADLNGNARITGEFTRRFSALSNADDLFHPVAYGFIDFLGNVVNGTPNVSATYNPNPSAEWYEIVIEDENYFFNEYVTIITASGSDIIARTGSSSGRLLVILSDANFNRRTSDFQFVTYRTSGAEARLAPRPKPQPLPASAVLDR